MGGQQLSARRQLLFHTTLSWRSAADRVALILGYGAASPNRQQSAANRGRRSAAGEFADQAPKSRWLRINLSTVCLL